MFSESSTFLIFYGTVREPSNKKYDKLFRINKKCSTTFFKVRILVLTTRKFPIFSILSKRQPILH